MCATKCNLNFIAYLIERHYILRPRKFNFKTFVAREKSLLNFYRTISIFVFLKILIISKIFYWMRNKTRLLSCSIKSPNFIIYLDVELNSDKKLQYIVFEI